MKVPKKLNRKGFPNKNHVNTDRHPNVVRKIRHAQKKCNHHSRTNHFQSNDDDIQYFFTIYCYSSCIHLSCLIHATSKASENSYLVMNEWYWHE